MASVLTIEGKEYVTATMAGTHFGYTKDYFLMLIKGGKIDGKKIGNKWYVHLPSAEAFFNTAAAVRLERRKRISAERKAELKHHTKVRKQSHRPRLALIETLVIMILGLSLGTMGYLGTATPQAATVTLSTPSFFERLALSLYTLITPTKPVSTTNLATTAATEDPLSHTAISTHIGTTTQTALVVAPDEIMTTTTIESIQDSFSDPVTVTTDTENPQTGVITPQFKNRTGEAYRFLMVPVRRATST